MDLKQFLEKKERFSELQGDGEVLALVDEENADSIENDTYVCVQDLGLFFWERGGKEWYKEQYESTNFVKLEEYIYNANQEAPDISNAKDFLDALACLGEDKIKELIKELK